MNRYRTLNTIKEPRKATPKQLQTIKDMARGMNINIQDYIFIQTKFRACSLDKLYSTEASLLITKLKEAKQ
jgi:hypothetical protein